jgi:hypothetical protein
MMAEGPATAKAMGEPRPTEVIEMREMSVAKASYAGEMSMAEMPTKMSEMGAAEMTKVPSAKVAATAKMSAATAAPEGECISCKSGRQKKRGCETEQFDGRARHVSLQFPVVDATTCEAAWPLH